MTKYGRDMGDDTNFGKNSVKQLKNEVLGGRDVCLETVKRAKRTAIGEFACLYLTTG